jgi:glyceraldehyde 3-phosphate dehydrogenase
MKTTAKSGSTSRLKLGINGLGRIGKLTLWNHVARRSFSEVVINVGRDVGTSFQDLAHYLERDSTYGSLGAFLYGHRGKPVIRDVDETSGTMMVDETRVKILRNTRNPKEIGWQENDVRLVVDATGKFLDPTAPPDGPKGSLRGHFEAGAEKVIVSAPFKIKDKSRPMPEDAVTTVMGVNEGDYDPRVHRMISAASCTTTCLAHMIKPLMDVFGAQRILTASMATVHAVTGSQEVLDRLPKAGATDLRKNRSVMNNIILTTTGAANTLGLVIPEMKHIGFIAESVRIPTSTGSLIILVVNLQEESSGESIRREVINEVYREAAARDSRGYLQFTEEQNVSSDIIGLPNSAALIEGHETHTRTADVHIDLQRVCRIGEGDPPPNLEGRVRIAITQAVIYGWYDNELGSYVHMLGDRIVSVAEDM